LLPVLAAGEAGREKGGGFTGSDLFDFI